ncbi:hypothetical protein DFS34DRAFT_575701 [Phlyctochytrium arcticum]|nr:hypothetical protein DFS34DRAFT_575701 [Phlyctochytrium arcticum]
MCFYNLSKLAGFQHFPALQSMCIIAQDIDEIEALEACPSLEKLWICETGVTRIKNLQHLTELRELYLYGNRIQRIEGLDYCQKLEKLWLSDNGISVLENLQRLSKLKVLHMGNNKIMSVGDALDENTNIEELNISGNLISSFREVLFFARLPKLTSLCLSDPNFADNPICSLCNYQTHVIYHLPKLRWLDTLEVTEESRRIINSTVMKKRMYYNMRIRTIKRNTNFLLKLLDVRTGTEQSRIEADVRCLVERVKKVQKRYDDHLLESPAANSTQPTSLAKVLSDAKYRLRQFVEIKTRTLNRLHLHKDQVHLQIIQQSDMAIRKLLLELETGGNVRFEDGHRDDPWMQECDELISTFLTRGRDADDNKRVQVHRVSRLHNRFLKNNFESKLNQRPDIERESFRYLSFQSHDENFEDLFSVIEYGFPDENVTQLHNYLDWEDFGAEENLGEVQGPRKKLRQALLVKAYTLDSAQSLDVLAMLHANSPALQNKDCIYQDLPGKLSSMDDTEPRRKYVFTDRHLLLPEFFVEYSVETDLDRLTTKAEKVMMNMAFSNKLAQAGMPGHFMDAIKKLPESASVNPGVHDMSLPTIEAQYPEVKITEDLVIFPRASFASPLPSNPAVVQFLNLTNSSQKTIDNCAAFVHITILKLSNCGLKSVPPLAFPKLEKLDLSFNSITTLDKLVVKDVNLQHLDVAGNLIEDRGGLSALYELANSLTVLDTRFNGVCKSKSYRRYICQKLPNIQRLDGILCKPKEEESHANMDLKAIIDHASTQPHLFRPLSVRTQTGYGFSAAQNEYWRLAHCPHLHESVMVEAITTLELDGCYLFDLNALPDGLVNLRWASFRNNSIRDVSKLAQYPLLEELSLENNEIESIDPLTALTGLIKLDVSINRISSIDCAREFQSLMLLSLENNSIRSLRPLTELPTLMEFYCGNNSIEDLLSIFPLKELPRLIILDFTGNAVCHLENYRLFTIYHLARLKILDGTGIALKEQNAAREAYLGKLTIELLGEKVGHLTFKNISELDLRNCKIREIDCFAGFDFRNLRKLTFDNNLLTNIDCFVGLTGLRYLSLNNNKLERLLSTDQPAPMTMGNGMMRLDTPEYGRQFVRTLLPNLEELHLGHNVISRIADLALYRLSHLKLLYLPGNRISKVDGLDHMTNLIELVLDKNQIKAAEPSSFVSLINLRELHVKENRIKTLSHFDCLPNLQHLNLSSNRVHDINEIEKMKLPSLLKLSLGSNAVARKQMYRPCIVLRFPHILAIDSKEVLPDERMRAESYFMEQCVMREDNSPMTKLAAQSGHLGPNSSNSNACSTQNLNGMNKLPIKITSVVLDGELWRRTYCHS